MPQLVRTIDQIVAERQQPVLMLRFGDLASFGSPEVKRKRRETLERLGAVGIQFEPCGPPPSSGWMSYLGDVALATPYGPGEEKYERLRAMFEDEDGKPLDPDIAFCLYDAGC